MKTTVNNLLSKSEVKFWLGIITVIVSVVLSGNKIVTEIALMKKDLSTLTTATENTNKNFTSIHEDVTKNHTAITVINTILKID